jgi:hypothetical protein
MSKSAPWVGTSIAYRKGRKKTSRWLAGFGARPAPITINLTGWRWTTLKRLRVIIVNLLLLSLPVLAWAGGGGEKATKLERKVDLANLSGLNYLFAQWYNDSIWLYALVATVLMGVIGLAIAVATDIILKMIGMEVSKIEHHE